MSQLESRPATSPIRGPDKLWGAPAISQALGVSVDTVYRPAKENGCPIYQPGGSYFAFRHELEAWLRTDSSEREVAR